MYAKLSVEPVPDKFVPKELLPVESLLAVAAELSFDRDDVSWLPVVDVSSPVTSAGAGRGRRGRSPQRGFWC